MDNQKFMEGVYDSYERSMSILREKEREYAVEGDRLIQFYEVSMLGDIDPCEALIGMANKHYSSIAHMVKNPHAHTLSQWDEKITDLRNYTFLLDALLRDMGVK